jgi:DNA mismatch repair protein MutL
MTSGPIRLLPTHVANKIAAGEVVERPASVAKELMENALDAGATRLVLTVSAGGRKLVELEDDGSGMGRDDALMCIERQATSKIRDVDDIGRIATYGFRGEALPSIASVSRFSLRTCRRGDPAGTELLVVGGTLQDVRDIGAPPGTTIAVRDLFFNVPARRKFLRTYQTEQANLRTAFLLAALARPDVGMVLRADGREIHNLPPASSREERVRDLFGQEWIDACRPVPSAVRLGVRIEGFVGIPSTARSGNGEQYFFVNGRAISSPVLAHALRESYPPSPAGRRPVVLLFLELDPAAVDVNVHPTKREVRFRRPGDVRDAVTAAIAEALGTTARPHAPESAAAAGPTPPPAAARRPVHPPPAQPPLPSGGAETAPAGDRKLRPAPPGRRHPPKPSPSRRTRTSSQAPHPPPGNGSASSGRSPDRSCCWKRTEGS